MIRKQKWRHALRNNKSNAVSVRRKEIYLFSHSQHSSRRERHQGTIKEYAFQEPNYEKIDFFFSWFLSFFFPFCFCISRNFVKFRPDVQSGVSLIKPANATTGRWLCASRQKGRESERQKKESARKSSATDFKASRKISVHKRNSLHSFQHSCINTQSSLFHLYILTSPFARESPSKNIQSHTRTFSLVPFTNDERRDTRLFLRARGRESCGKRKKLADFLASDVASPTL